MSIVTMGATLSVTKPSLTVEKQHPEEGSKQNQNGIMYGVLPRRMKAMMSISCLIEVKNGQTNKGAFCYEVHPVYR